MQSIEYEYSKKSVSPWSGMRIVKELIDRIGLENKLQQLPLPQPGSNRGHNPVSLIMGFLVSIWIGRNRFAHSASLRQDEVLRSIFGWKRIGSESTFSSFFRKFSIEKNNKIFPLTQCWMMSQFKKMKVTIDLDNTIIERYGKEEGGKRGYNPRKPGHNSHHPLIAFISEIKLVANGLLRPGNSSCGNNVISFLKETFYILETINCRFNTGR